MDKASKPNLGTWYLDRYVTMAGRPEREAVLEFLKAAYAQEYLTEAEHERRAGLALGARDTRALGALIQDLPYSIELPGQPVPADEGSWADPTLEGVAKDVLLGLLFGVAVIAVAVVAVLVLSALAGQS